MLQNRAQTPISSSAWVPFCLMLIALVLRVLTQQNVIPATWSNFSPLMAFAFAGALVFPKHLPWWSWAFLLLGVDWISQGSSLWAQADGRWEIFLAYGCYTFAAWMGSGLRRKIGIIDSLIGTLAFSVLFYLVTNSLSWWVKPYYAKDFTGWVQALTIGVAGPWPTTLEFFRNSLIADFLGASLILGVYNAEALLRHLRLMPWKSRETTLSM